MTLDEQLEGLGRLLSEAREHASKGDVRALAHSLRNLATNATLLAGVVVLRPVLSVKDTIRKKAG